jgi:hypothetical protein
VGNYRITLPLLNDGGIYERLADKAAVGGNWTMRCQRFEWPTWPAYGRDRHLALAPVNGVG